MRAMWKGAVAFGLVSVPVKLYSATSQHDVPLNMVHREDGGRIRYRKVCSVDGEEVPQEEIARAHTTADGDVVILDDEDLDSLPTSTGHEIEVHEFVPAEQVDPIMLDKTYYLEPEAKATKPYALLRGALEQTDRMAVVTVTLRRRECMAVLRVRDDVIVMQTMLWPDEVRAPEFDILAKEVDVRPQELQMAASLVESMAADFDPDQYEDGWTAALRELIAAKTEGGDVRPAPLPASDDGDAQIVDLMAALRESVERTGASRGNRGTRPPAVEAVADEPAARATGRRPGTTTASRTAAGTPAKKAATKAATTAKTTAAKDHRSKDHRSKEHGRQEHGRQDHRDQDQRDQDQRDQDQRDQDQRDQDRGGQGH
jgi:DNA end-binding protein Ku